MYLYTYIYTAFFNIESENSWIVNLSDVFISNRFYVYFGIYLQLLNYHPITYHCEIAHLQECLINLID